MALRNLLAVSLAHCIFRKRLKTHRVLWNAVQEYYTSRKAFQPRRRLGQEIFDVLGGEVGTLIFDDVCSNFLIPGNGSIRLCLFGGFILGVKYSINDSFLNFRVTQQCALDMERDDVLTIDSNKVLDVANQRYHCVLGKIGPTCTRARTFMAPESSIVARSPVFSHPSFVKDASVALGFCQ